MLTLTSKLFFSGYWFQKFKIGLISLVFSAHSLHLNYVYKCPFSIELRDSTGYSKTQIEPSQQPFVEEIFAINALKLMKFSDKVISPTSFMRTCCSNNNTTTNIG